MSYSSMAISSPRGSAGLQSVTLPTAVVSLFSLPCKTLKLLPVIQVALKEKVYILPPTQTVKTVDTSTDFCLLWSILQALLLSLFFFWFWTVYASRHRLSFLPCRMQIAFSSGTIAYLGNYITAKEFKKAHWNTMIGKRDDSSGFHSELPWLQALFLQRGGISCAWAMCNELDIAELTLSLVIFLCCCINSEILFTILFCFHSEGIKRGIYTHPDS